MTSYLDHIIWACDDLERGSRRFEELTGVRPRYGGAHASGLTHNALVSIGNDCYLEILAPVGPETKTDDPWCRLARASREPRMVTYCLRSPRSLSALASVAETLGIKTSVAANGRTTPEGVQLKWQWLAMPVERFGLAFPFFIDWLDSPHPAASPRPATPERDVELLSFAVGHPDAAGLQGTLAKLGSAVETFSADGVQFRTRLRTPLGEVAL